MKTPLFDTSATSSIQKFILYNMNFIVFFISILFFFNWLNFQSACIIENIYYIFDCTHIFIIYFYVILYERERGVGGGG